MRIFYTEVTHEIGQYIDGKGQIDIFLNFSRAFDKISHRNLLLKLSCLLVETHLLKWIEAYLSDREQFISLKNACSTNKPVRSGVLQGSMIGPLLFSVYISSMGNSCSEQVTIKNYAGNSIVYAKICSSNDQVELNTI